MNQELKDELEQLGALLPPKTKDNGFRVPYNYFDNLPDKVLAAAKNAPVPSPVHTSESWWDRLVGHWSMPRYAMAFASVLVVLGVGIYTFQSYQQTQYDSFASISEAELDGLVSSEAIEWEEDIILENTSEDLFSTSNGLEELSTDELLENSSEQMDDDDLEEFL